MISAIQKRVGFEIPFLLTMSVLLVVIGSFGFPGFLSATYLMQQAQIASFLGIIAIGAFLVIMIGQIDLSVPWTITAAAMVTTSMTGSDNGNAWLAIPAGLAVGAAIGALNGIGVAVLRVPSMIWTLGINAVVLGCCILFTGGFAPAGQASDAMQTLAVGHFLGIPNSFLLWMVLALATVAFLRFTILGKSIIAIGNSERAAYLSGVETRRVIIACFVCAGLMSAMGGLLLVGYSNQAYQAMGDQFLLPVIASVVVGGTRLQGGKGSAIAVALAVLFLSLLTSVLSVFQVDGSIKQCVYGAVMLVTLFIYGRFRNSVSL
jgi:ribose transport system permease protein